jgi:heme A synthase
MFTKRFAVFLTFLVFLLILAGGIVHNTGSSLACPDWPTCYGTFMPPMVGGVAIEHSHRLLATAVGLLTIVLVFLLWKKGRALRWMGLAALFLVVFQGVLGGITVLYKLPTIVSTAHLATSMLFFSLLILIDRRLYSGKFSFSLPVFCVALLAYLQNILGAFVRHTGAGLICPDIPFCNGSPWPVDLHPIFRLHMAHRWMGMVVALAVSWLASYIWKTSDKKSSRRLSLLAVGLVFLQIGLGLSVILTQKEIVPLTAHLGVAALLLGTLVSLL